MKIDVVRLDFEELSGGRTLPFEDPLGLCRIDGPTRRALVENPFQDSWRGPTLLVGTVDGRAAGVLMLVPGEIVVDGEVTSIAWCSGLYVAPEYRSTLLGIAIVREARRCNDVVGGSRVADGAFRIFSRLGWTGVPLTRYLLPRQSRPVVEHLVGRGRSASVLRPLLNAILRVHHWVLGGKEIASCRGLRPVAVESMPSDLDPALSGLSHPYGCHRSSRWLNWVTDNSFGSTGACRKQIYLVHDHDNRRVAYFITRIRLHSAPTVSGVSDVRLGSVLDWGVFDPSVVNGQKIWLMATNRLTTSGAEAVEICLKPGDAGLPFGFRPFGWHRMALLSNVDGTEISHGTISHWRLRQIDADSALS